MFAQAAIAFLLGYAIGAKLGPNAKWLVGGLIALIPLLFAWGFYKNLVGAYNAYILLCLVQLPKQFGDFASNPVAASFGLAVAIAMLAFVWYVRAKLFPDFGFLAPKKTKGQYVFTS